MSKEYGSRPSWRVHLSDCPEAAAISKAMGFRKPSDKPMVVIYLIEEKLKDKLSVTAFTQQRNVEFIADSNGNFTYKVPISGGMERVTTVSEDNQLAISVNRSTSRDKPELVRFSWDHILKFRNEVMQVAKVVYPRARSLVRITPKKPPVKII